MFKAFRHLVYFSDVFPVKYWKKFIEPKVEEKKESMNKLDIEYFSGRSYHSQNAKSIELHKRDNSLLSNKSYYSNIS